MIFLPVDVIGNITGLVASLGSQGLVGLGSPRRHLLDLHQEGLVSLTNGSMGRVHPPQVPIYK